MVLMVVFVDISLVFGRGGAQAHGLGELVVGQAREEGICVADAGWPVVTVESERCHVGVVRGPPAWGGRVMHPHVRPAVGVAYF